MKVKEHTESQRALQALAGAMLLGVLAIVAYAIHVGGSQDFLTILSVGVFVAGAAAFVGGTLGFLFGIPRTLQSDVNGSGAVVQAAGANDESLSRRIEYRANTNLEQISDWLTKILVGVGLTQISQIREGLGSLALFVSKGLGAHGPSEVFALALLSYSTVLGFLFGYLWTRLFLAGALRVADEAAIGTLVAQVKKATEKADATARKLNELEAQAERDAAALNLVYRQLNPSADLPQVAQDELNAAVSAAGRPIKVQIFNQAWQMRADNWQEVSKKPKMERAIPVFRALIASDVENRYHMNHGQLGFALKDQREPDWAEAEKELNTAIEIRGSWQKRGWLFYEFNRAFCRIMSDPAFLQDKPSDAARKDQILEDLAVAAHGEDLLRIIKSEEILKKWMSLNKIDTRRLRSHRL